VDVGLLGSNAMYTCNQVPTFRSNILPPSSGLKVEAVCSSGILLSWYSVTTQKTNIDEFK
jgi:hypothetical protein